MKTFNKFIFAALFAVAGFGVYEITSIDTSKAAAGTKLNQNQLPSTVPLQVTVHLDSAQIVNLLASPVMIVDTPGAGFTYMITYAQFIVHGAASTPYDVSSGGSIQFKIGTISTFQPSTAFKNALTSIDDQMYYTFLLATADNNPCDSISNKPLMLTQDGGGEYSSGNATVDVVLEYIKVRAK